jgi:hypothetical protein
MRDPPASPRLDDALLQLGAMRTAMGAAEFDGLPGAFMGIPVVQSTTVLYGATTNMVLVDAGSILLADDGQVTVDVSREASVEMSDTPIGSGALVSLWQTNAVGILCERFITWLVARAGAVQASAVTVNGAAARRNEVAFCVAGMVPPRATAVD